MKKTIIITLFVFASIYGFAASADSDPPSFFHAEREVCEKSLLELYDQGKLFEANSYPILRRIVSQKIAADYQDVIEKEWGNSDDSFGQWLEQHPELLEEYLTAIDLNKDDLESSLRLMKRICVDYPETVEKYPGLTVALMVVWDQPDSAGFASDSRTQYQATAPPDAVDAKDNFIFYTKENHPAANILQQLPWEFLVYVVCNKRSLEERKWVFENYGEEKNVPAKAYNDVSYISGNTMSEKPYSLQNMKEYGGVCTCRADYALPVSRTLGIPAFYGGAGFPRYYGGHSWVMWLDVEDADENAVVFQFRQEGRGNPRYFVAGYESPQTGQLETDEDIQLRFHRAGKDVRAFRHSALLLRCYQTLLNAKYLSVKERVDFLMAVNEISPQNRDVWREIAKLGKNRKFTAEHRPIVQDLAYKMREDLTDFPNELSGLTTDLLSFPEMRDQKIDDCWKIFEPLFGAMRAKRRPDLVITAIMDFNRIRVAYLREKSDATQSTDIWLRHMTERKDFQTVENAAFMLKNLTKDFANEISMMNRVFDELESVMEIPGYTIPGGLNDTYADYAKRLETDLSHLPKDYRRDVLRRFQAYFRKYGNEERVSEMKAKIEKLDAPENNSSK